MRSRWTATALTASQAPPTMPKLSQGEVSLMPLDRALALELGRDDGRVPVAAIALERDVVAEQARLDDRLEFFGCHIKVSSADFVADAQQVDGDGAHHQPGGADDAQAEPG